MLEECRRLGMPWWQVFLLTVASSLVSVCGQAAWAAIRRIDWKIEPAPEPISDGGVASDRDLVHPTLPTGEPPENGGAG